MTRRILAASALLAAMVWCASAMAQKAPAGAGGQVMAAKADPALPPVYTDPGEIPRLTMAGDAKRALPLEHTHVDARITGFVAEVEVRQTYKNDADKPIEARYIFPLPENSAVSGMEMVIGDRTIVAKIDKRAAARRRYEAAKRKGHTAALLEQERPNVFTQSVANIAPGKKIDVVIRYVQDLTYDAGFYEFVFPMVVGPRFNPPSVKDAARITPKYVGRGERTGHDISLSLKAMAGGPIEHFSVPTHDVAVRKPADGTLQLTLAEKKSIPNRDFVLRYRASGEKPAAALFVGRPGPKGGHFSLVLHPPAIDVERLVGRREIIFVVDVSGSMHGVPLGMCRTAMKEALRKLRPTDTFNILTFAGGTRRAFAKPRPANTTNVRRAMQVIDGMRAGGGTHMASAVSAALSPDVAPGRHRYVFFMTDGYIGNEGGIISGSSRLVRALEQRGQKAKVFGFGVGSSVNRNLLEGLSRAGKGIAHYATTREDPRRGVNKFFHAIDHAVLAKVAVDWGGFVVDDVLPREIPDLFASHPVIVHGHYTGSTPNALSATAHAGETQITLPIVVRKSGLGAKTAPVLSTLWARAKVGFLEELLYEGHRDVRKAITTLGLEHGLVTRYTSFVAVDTSTRVGDGNPDLVEQPVDAPEGVNVAMAGGLAYGAMPAQPSPPPEMAPQAEEDLALRRACGCRVPGAPGTTPRGLFVLLTLLAAALLRRRRCGKLGA